MEEITYGEVFKKLRNNRNMTMKSVAEGIVSIQTLRRFELGKTSVAFDIFSQLLDRIAVNYSDFFYEFFKHNHKSELEEELGKLQLDGNFTKMASYIKQYLQKKDITLSERIFIATAAKGFIGSIISPTPSAVKENERIVIDYLGKIDEFYTSDYGLLYSLFNSNDEEPLFTLEFIKHCIEAVLNQKVVPYTPLAYERKLSQRRLLRSAISYLSRRGELELAEEYCIQSIEKMKSDTYDEALIENIIIQHSVLAQIQLRRGKPEGVELANRVVAMYDSRIALYNHNLDIMLRRDLVKHLYEINKTGIEFDF